MNIYLSFLKSVFIRANPCPIFGIGKKAKRKKEFDNKRHESRADLTPLWIYGKEEN